MSILRRLWPCLLATGSLLLMLTLGSPQRAAADDVADEEARQQQIAARFLTILEKTPRRGTALDRVYGHHVEFGTLDAFLQSLKDRVAANAADGAAWMLLGLMEAQRGQDAAAAAAFAQAETHRPEDALPAYYHAQSLLLLGEPEQAVAAFERAISRKPPRADLLEILQQLGRVHQRAQRTEAALNVWNRMEQLFPDDARVQEQIAVTLVEEGQFEQALPRYARLVELVEDEYRQTSFRIEMAELKIRLARKADGLADLEALLANLNPESWLHRDVRRRIDDVYLRTGDQDGLVAYYERWLAEHPDDVDGMARLARYLARSARIPEATNWMEKALKLAPSRTELRRAFIAQLVDDQRYTEAIAQYVKLNESDPGNPDVLRDWGKLVLKDQSMPVEDRRREAVRVWNQILTARPNDAVSTVQVADLLRQSNLADEALALYQRGVELAPNDPQYREYLGEYYHILQRRDEALATWREIAAGDRHTALNVARLAEVLHEFGYFDEAVEQIAEACRLEPKDFSLWLKAANYHERTAQYEAALADIAAAAGLAANDDEREAVLKQRIEVLQTSGKLAEEVERLAAAAAESPASATGWYTLARYYEAERRWTEATASLDRALELEATSIPVLTCAARIAELSGDLGRAADVCRQLSNADRRSRGDHLTNVARLESQLGRIDQALQAGRDLIASAPGNTSHYEFYAQLCFRLGRTDEGLETLRKAVRISPGEPGLITQLGAALAEQFRTDEAIQIYWRAFEAATTLDDRTQLIAKLTDLHLQLNQFDQLLERLERDRREDDRRREMTICLAQAQQSSGDYGAARQELESLLSQDTRDTQLLQQLSKLCEDGGDLEAAIKYQDQLVSIAPGAETEFRMAQLLQTNGDQERASEILVRLTQREEDESRRLRSLDALLRQASYQPALVITETWLRDDPGQWEILYREGYAWAALDRTAEATERFRRLLALTRPYDEQGIRGREQMQQALARAKSNNQQGLQTALPAAPTPLSMLSSAGQIRQSVGLNQDTYYSSSPQQIWMPSAFGEARMAAYGWLLKFASQSQTEEALLASIRERGEAADAPLTDVIDWAYVLTLKSDTTALLDVARRLAAVNKDGQMFFLRTLQTRPAPKPSAAVSSTSSQTPPVKPLSAEDLALMLECYRAATSKTDGENVAFSSSGQVYVMSLSGSYVPATGGQLTTVIAELTRAGRVAEAEEVLNQAIGEANTAAQYQSLIRYLISREEFDRAEPLLTLWLAAAREEAARRPANARSSRSVTPALLSQFYSMALTWMGQLGPRQRHAEVLKLLDFGLDIAISDAEARRTQISSRQKSRTISSGSRSITVYYGGRGQSVRVDYPTPNLYLDTYTIYLLRQAHEIYLRNDVLSDLAVHLRQRLEGASPDHRIYELMFLGAELWWADEKEEAVQLLTQAAGLVPEDPTFRLELATMHEARQDFDGALAIVDSVIVRDQQLLQLREIMALQLAERLGDIDRARAAAERLFGLRLDSNTQIALVSHMRRLGLEDMAEAVVSRVQRRSGNQPTALVSLMTLYQGQGRTELAQQVAHTILRTTRPAPSVALGVRSSFVSSSDTSGVRNQALKLLHQTGALQPIIERLESQLDQSTGSARLYDQLVECYSVSGNRQQVGALLTRSVEQRPELMELRLQLARHLESTGDVSGACGQYLEILRRKPALIRDNFYQLQNLFVQAKRLTELADVLKTIDLKSFGHPYYVLDTADNLLRNEETQELGLQIIERAMESFPNYQGEVFSRLSNASLWKIPRVYDLSVRGLIPSPEQARANPWQGLDRIYSYSGNGEITSSAQQVLQGVVQANRAGDLRQAVEAGLEAAPEWYGGRVILLMLDLKQGRLPRGLDQINALLSDEEALKQIPSATGWIVGQELKKFPETQPLALRLFEHAAADTQNNTNLSYSPVQQLVRLQADAGQPEKAKNTLLAALRRQENPGYADDYYVAEQIRSEFAAAEQLSNLNFPVEAFRIYRKLLNDPARLTQAGARYASRPDYFSNQVRAGFDKALAQLDSTDARAAIAELLAESAHRGDGGAVLDLMLTQAQLPTSSRIVQVSGGQVIATVSPNSRPSGQSLSQSGLESPVVRILDVVCQNPANRQLVQGRLAELQAAHPTDLSIAVLNAVYCRKFAPEDFEQSLRALTDLVQQQPLEEVPTGGRPNSRQRHIAQQSLPVWLIAQDCLREPALHAQGEILARRALEAAERQVDDGAAIAILYRWGELELEQNHRDEAERRWSQLLDLVTRRPTSSAAANNPRPAPRPATGSAAPAFCGEDAPDANFEDANSDDANSDDSACDDVEADDGVEGERDLDCADPPSRGSAAAPASERPATPNAGRPARETNATPRIPPLTLSQFNKAIELARIAAEHDMRTLSIRAFRESLVGGAPVPDTEPQTSSSTQLRSAGASASGAGSSGESGVNATVTPALISVLRLWESRNYPADEVCDLIRPLVLPPDRPMEVHLYPDSSSLTLGRVVSLGETLARWSAQVGRVDEIRQEVVRRREHPAARLAAEVLLTQLALAAQDVPTAREHLQQIAARLNAEGLPVHLNLACHAAIPAFDIPELQSVAAPIVMRALLQSSQATNTQTPVLGKLSLRVLRYLAAHNETDQVRQFLVNYETARQAHYARYSGNYALYQQASDWATIASHAAEIGLLDVARDMLGRVADYEPQDYSVPSVMIPLAALTRPHPGQSAAERYEQWRDWTLPHEKRRSLRLVATIVPLPEAPAEFFPSPEAAAAAARPSCVVSNWTELVSAAREADRLEELSDAVKAAEQAGIDGAASLHALVAIARGDAAAAESAVTARIRTFDEQKATADPAAFPAQLRSMRSQLDRRMWADVLLFLAIADDPDLKSVGDKLFTPLQQSTKSSYPEQHELIALANARRDRLGRSLTIAPGDDSRLQYWTAVNDADSKERLSWWATHEGVISSLSGFGVNRLFFNYPLEGDFEFTVDVGPGSAASGAAGYAGVTYVPSYRWLQSFSGHDRIVATLAATRGANDLNQLTIQSRGGRVRQFLNQQLIFEGDATTAPPWLQLSAVNYQDASFHHPRLTGEPRIPRRVDLLADRNLYVWNSSDFGESQPHPLTVAAKSRLTDADPNYYRYDQAAEPDQYDWTFLGDVLTGRQFPDAEPSAQSRLYYERPLVEGDAVRYEFFYRAGQSAVHPAVGRIAYLLTPEGVRLHWMARPDIEVSLQGIAVDNVVVDDKPRRGPQVLPLRDGDWNEVVVQLRDAAVVLSLNGEVIYERPLDPGGDRKFSFFRYRRELAQVRSAVLAGDWPETLPELTPDLLVTTRGQLSQGDQRWLASIIGRDVLELPKPVLERVANLPDDEAYALLHDWVLPSSYHGEMRLTYERAPLRSAADSEERLLCPAMELARLAQKLGKTAELLAEIERDSRAGAAAKRNQLALSTMLHIAAGDDVAARAGLDQLFLELQQSPPTKAQSRQRVPPWLAVWMAAERPALQPAAYDLVQLLLQQHRAAKSPDDWGREVDSALARVQTGLQQSAGSPAEASDFQLTQWTTLPFEDQRSRFSGLRPSTWTAERGEVRHLPREAYSELYFQSPLQGRFEVRLQKSNLGYRELLVFYGQQAVDISSDQKSREIVSPPFSRKLIPSTVSLPKWEDWLDYQLVIDGQNVKTYVNGVELQSEVFTPAPDPWLVLQAKTAGFASRARNVRILGEPIVPEQIDLIRTAGLSSWRANFYGESLQAAATDRRSFGWYKSSDEITAEISLTDSPARRESLLRYHRPMLENGEIEFEFHYVPGEFEVHPALGRAVFLLRPDGVRLHQLTDGIYESTGLSSDNETPLADARPLSLKPNDWNRAKLALSGDRVTISVNNEDVAHWTAPADELRWFGLFRFFDQNRVRVRNCTWRGDWPGVVPSLEEQQLAAPAQSSVAASASDRLPVVVDLDLAGPDRAAAWEVLAGRSQIPPTALSERGLHLQLLAEMTSKDWPVVRLPQAPRGDFELTVDYTGFNPTQTAGWGCNFATLAKLEDARSFEVELGLAQSGNGQQSARAGLLRVLPDKQSKLYSTSRVAAPQSGRMRLIRRGGVMHCQLADGPEGEFQTLDSVPVGGLPVKELRITAKGAAGSATEVTLTRITLKAELQRN